MNDRLFIITTFAFEYKFVLSKYTYNCNINKYTCAINVNKITYNHVFRKQTKRAAGQETHEPARLDGTDGLEAAQLSDELHEQQPDRGEFG